MYIIDEFFNKKKYQAYRTVFNPETPESKVVLQDLCEAHGVFSGGFDPDIHMRDFAAGERNVVLRILTILNLTHDEIIELSKED